MRPLLVFFLSLTLAGCDRPIHRLAESRSFSFGRAKLLTQFVEHRPTGKVVPLVHVLFVPDWDIDPRAAHGAGVAQGGTVDRLEFECTFDDVRTQPIRVVDGTTVEASGRTWELRAGNVIVAIVNRDGTLRITQLATNETAPERVLASIKQALPAEPRVQTLEAKR